MEEQWKKENMELWNSKEMREAYGRDNYRVSCRKIGMIGNISQKAGSCKIVQTK